MWGGRRRTAALTQEVRVGREPERNVARDAHERRRRVRHTPGASAAEAVDLIQPVCPTLDIRFRLVQVFAPGRESDVGA